MNILKLAVLGALSGLGLNALAQTVYWSDPGSYTFVGLTQSHTISGSASGATSIPGFYVNLTTPVPVNTTLYVAYTASVTQMDPSSASLGYLFEVYDQGGSFTYGSSSLSPVQSGRVIMSLLTSGGSAGQAYFGVNTWGSAGGVDDTGTFSDFVIYSLPPGPSAADTQASLQSLAGQLKPRLILSKAGMENALSYDCNRFDAKNLCFSAIGRTLSGNGLDYRENAAAVVLTYRLSPNWRIGGFVDQGSASTSPGIRVSSDMPLVGVNAIWNANPAGEGMEVRSALAHRQQSLDVTRDVMGTSEAGSGNTKLSSTLVSVTAAYNQPVSDAWTVAPYAGVRYYRGQMNGYTEGASGSVTAPLTLAALNESTVTASLGVRVHGRFGKTQGSASVGLDRDLTSDLDGLVATGVSGLTTETFSGHSRHATRAVASVGLSRDLGDRQSIGLTALYRQEAFRSTATTAIFAQYKVGF